MAKLSDEQVARAIEHLPGWRFQGGKLHREYRFPDFVHAFGFMATAAIAIEAMNHHPDWQNSWNRVTVDLVTHSEGGVTEKDFKLAQKLETLAEKLS
ncbi:MAG: 4a-hydroxytetrahydrobiopterin dehydratase [Acidobacteria bacterium]|nr:4a-hydroxytetrahydrobiopterin dehydratase [Acidobacteriota bacterium]